MSAPSPNDSSLVSEDFRGGPKPSKALERFSTEYLDYHRISPARARQQRQLLAELEASLGEGRALTDITHEEFQAFAGRLLEQGLHVNTVRKKLNMIRPFFSWAYAVSLMDAERFMRLRLVRNPRGSSGRTVPRPYTTAQVKQLWAELADVHPRLPRSGRGSRSLPRYVQGKSGWTPALWHHGMRLQMTALIRLALDCGLRCNEIYGLSLADVHYDNEYVVVKGKADPNTGLAKVRQVPMTKACREAVHEWVEFRTIIRPKHDRPWLSCVGSRHAEPMAEKRFYELLGKFGSGWEWHRLRHTAGTQWLRSGADLEIVQRLLGHSRIDQTLGYAQIAKGDIAAKLGKVEETFAKSVAA